MILQHLQDTKYLRTGLCTYLIPIIILCTRPIIILHVRDMRKICIPIVDNILYRYTHHRHYPTQADAETFDVYYGRVYTRIYVGIGMTV